MRIGGSAVDRTSKSLMEDVKAVEDSAISISPAQSGSVEQILVAAGAKGTPRVAVERVLAVAGKGLEGDRYFGQRPGRYAADRQVTLIEAEAVDAVRAGGLPFTAADARRNLVTRRVRL